MNEIVSRDYGESVRRTMPEHLLNRLTLKQRKFVLGWNGDPKSSLINAGYSASSPSAISGAMIRLMKIKEVRILVDHINETLEGAAIASVIEVRSYWTNVMRDDESTTTERMAASKLLGQAYGVFSEKLIVESKHTSLEVKEYVFAGPQSNFLKSRQGAAGEVIDVTPCPLTVEDLF